MSPKIITITLVTLILLSSCSWTENNLDTTQTTPSTKVEQAKVEVIATGSIILSEAELKEKRKAAFLKNVPDTEKQVFIDLEKATRSKDTQKMIELRKDIQKLEVIKRKLLTDTVKAGDLETAKKLRREMQIFSEMRR